MHNPGFALFIAKPLLKSEYSGCIPISRGQEMNPERVFPVLFSRVLSFPGIGIICNLATEKLFVSSN